MPPEPFRPENAHPFDPSQVRLIRIIGVIYLIASAMGFVTAAWIGYRQPLYGLVFGTSKFVSLFLTGGSIPPRGEASYAIIGIVALAIGIVAFKWPRLLRPLLLSVVAASLFSVLDFVLIDDCGRFSVIRAGERLILPAIMFFFWLLAAHWAARISTMSWRRSLVPSLAFFLLIIAAGHFDTINPEHDLFSPLPNCRVSDF